MKRSLTARTLTLTWLVAATLALPSAAHAQWTIERPNGEVRDQPFAAPLEQRDAVLTAHCEAVPDFVLQRVDVVLNERGGANEAVEANCPLPTYLPATPSATQPLFGAVH